MDIGRLKNTCHGPQLSPRKYSKFKLTPLTGALGAHIEGVNLKSPDEETISELKQAWADHLVLMFPKQFLTPADLLSFGSKLGKIERHKYWKGLDGFEDVFELNSTGSESVHYGSNWHSDLTCSEIPPMASILSALEIPEVGGDTMFTNLYLAYDSLSDTYKQILSGLQGVHLPNFQVNPEKKDFNESGQSEQKFQTQVLHPLVCKHHMTGKRHLLVNRIFTKSIHGMSKEESSTILEYLYLHLSRPEFTCRFRWQNGDVLIWDNLATAHYAIGDFRDRSRRLHRITLEGHKPKA